MVRPRHDRDMTTGPVTGQAREPSPQTPAVMEGRADLRALLTGPAAHTGRPLDPQTFHGG